MSQRVAPQIETVVEKFATLFEGRHDAFGADWGGSIKVENGTPSWYQIAEEHLLGDGNYGVYPMVPKLVHKSPTGEYHEWYVRWGCVDFDIKTEAKPAGDYANAAEARAAANCLVGVLRRLGIFGWPEESKSGGYHVWVFAQDWVYAWNMRRALLAACKLADVSAREVNPKSESFPEPKRLGNYVRLPYPGGLIVTPERQAMLGQAGPLDVFSFVDAVMPTLATKSAIESASKLWVPTTVNTTPINTDRGIGDTGFERIVKKLNGLAYTIFEEGPLSARHKALFKLAVECKASGLTQDEAYLIVADADARWGKFSERADAVERLTETVRRAYGG